MPVISLTPSIEERAAFIKQYFNVEWPDRHIFHLMVNSTIGVNIAVDTILNSIALLQKAPAAPAPQEQQPATQ